MAEEKQRIRGKPCLDCGCPYPGDHVIGCPQIAVEDKKRIDTLMEALNAFGEYFDAVTEASRALRAKLEPFARK